MAERRKPMPKFRCVNADEIPKIDVDLIPEHVRMNMLRVLFDELKEKRQDPEWMAGYEKWKAAEDAKRTAAAKEATA